MTSLTGIVVVKRIRRVISGPSKQRLDLRFLTGWLR